MFRTVTLLAAALALATPALAQQARVTREVTTVITIPAAEYERWQRMGFSTPDIFYAYNTAAATNRPVEEIFAMRRAGQSWEQIATSLQCPVYRVYGVPSSLVAGERIEATRRGMPAGATGAGLAAYGAHERALPDRFYREGYVLTPREYKRLRAQGFTPDEVYMIANAAAATGLDPQVFASAIYRGMYARDISVEFGIMPRRLTRVLPEWKTAEWAAAIGEPALTKDRLDVWY